MALTQSQGFFYFIIATFISDILCKTSFMKDMKTDVQFPPVNVHSVAGIPEGHLRPLGKLHVLPGFYISGEKKYYLKVPAGF